MATNAQYALMAGAAYRSTVADKNQFPAPDGWTLVDAHPQDNATGFEAYAFGNAATPRRQHRNCHRLCWHQFEQPDRSRLGNQKKR